MRHPLGITQRGWGGREIIDPTTSQETADCETYRPAAYSSQKTGMMPRPGVDKCVGNIPGYRGHIARKEAENVHGGTWQAVNERSHQTRWKQGMARTMSAPEFWPAEQKGFEVCPRVPGYMGHIPGKLSETVHGSRFSDANEKAQTLRSDNPFSTHAAWLRKRHWVVDKASQYNLTSTRFLEADSETLFTPEESAEAHLKVSRLGRTFGLDLNQPPRRAVSCQGTCLREDKRRRFLYRHIASLGSKRIDPTSVPVAGKPSWSPILDQQRWLLHNTIALGNGNQRAAYG